MSIFLSVAICCVVFSWFRAKRLGVPWFSAGKPQAKKARRVKPRVVVAFSRLDELTHNAETSRRLVEHVRRLHPDRDLNWCEEKALYDMKRDRMA